jgi:hypothetical protein
VGRGNGPIALVLGNKERWQLRQPLKGFRPSFVPCLLKLRQSGCYPARALVLANKEQRKV